MATRIWPGTVSACDWSCPPKRALCWLSRKRHCLRVRAVSMRVGTPKGFRSNRRNRSRVACASEGHNVAGHTAQWATHDTRTWPFTAHKSHTPQQPTPSAPTASIVNAADTQSNTYHTVVQQRNAQQAWRLPLQVLAARRLSCSQCRKAQASTHPVPACNQNQKASTQKQCTHGQSWLGIPFHQTVGRLVCCSTCSCCGLHTQCQ